MDSTIPRRQALKTLGAAGAGALIGVGVSQAQAMDAADTAAGAGSPIEIAGRRVQVALEPVSRETVRISVLPLEGASASASASATASATTPATIPLDGSLVKPAWAKPAARITALPTAATEERVRAGDLTVIVSFGPSISSGANGGGAANALTIRIEAADGRVVQHLRVDAATGGVTFPLGDAPVLGFGQGGPQFDRRGIVDRMRSGAGACREEERRALA